MTQQKRQVVITPVIERLDNLPEHLRFLNVYIDQNCKHLEMFSLRKRYVAEILKTLVEKYEAVVHHIKTSDTYYVTLDFDKNKIVMFLYPERYETHMFKMVVATSDKPRHLVEFINSLPLDENSFPNSIDLSYFYMSSRKGLAEREMGIEVTDLSTIYPELYPDIDVQKLVKNYNGAQEPILMLYGEPGVGKTSFIKYIISSGEYKKIAYIKDPKVMEDGELWALLTRENYDLVIFDDLDIALLPRQKNADSTFMTQLLSYSDGIFTQGKTKIVITTNQAIKEIDSALIRPGRCFDFISLNPLEVSDAKAFWTGSLKLDEASFDSLFKGARIISQATVMSEAARVKSATGNRDYIKRGSKQYTLEQKLAALSIKSSSGNDGRASF